MKTRPATLPLPFYAIAFFLMVVFAGTVAAQPRSAVAASTTFLGPSAYLSFGDSPFSGVSFSFFHLEDFEDGALNEPGLSASSGQVLFPGSFQDSVDGDDGAVDGSGTGGHSWLGASSITFSFDGGVLGSLPTHAGIVWTDVGFASPTDGFDSVTFEAFDGASASLGTIGPVSVGDGLKTGQTAEDRFFGVAYGGGISSISPNPPMDRDGRREGSGRG